MPNFKSAAVTGEPYMHQDAMSVPLQPRDVITLPPTSFSSQSRKTFTAICATTLAACGTGNKSGTDSSGFTGTVAIIGVVVSGAVTTWALSDDLAYLERDATYPFRPLKRGIVPITSENAIDSSSQT